MLQPRWKREQWEKVERTMGRQVALPAGLLVNHFIIVDCRLGTFQAAKTNMFRPAIVQNSFSPSV